jgi:hypothetical protein
MKNLWILGSNPIEKKHGRFKIIDLDWRKKSRAWVRIPPKMEAGLTYIKANSREIWKIHEFKFSYEPNFLGIMQE